jgi:hypothetical protein
MSHPETNSEGTWAIAKPENANKVFYGLCTLAILLVVTDLVFTLYMRSDGHEEYLKGHFGFEDIIGFHAAYGFMAFVLVVLSGSHLRSFLMRPLDFYDVPPEEKHDDHHGDAHQSDVHHEDENTGTVLSDSDVKQQDGGAQ